ncbi:MAG: nitrogenase component 1 [Elusimicrobiota bacterium]
MSRGTDLSPRYNAPYLVGVYLAANAVRDAAVVIDGMSCAMSKAEFIAGNHDVFSTLLAPGGAHRIVCTMSDPLHLHHTAEEPVQRTLRALLSSRRPAVVLLGALPMGHLAGIDYERIARRETHAGKAPIVPVSAGFDGDWLDGYGEALDAIARHIRVAGARPDPRRAAVIGYLWDRNERDHQANLYVIRGLLERLGLKLESLWLSGGDFKDLERVRNAGTLISLPYGRKAGRTLAQRLRRPLVELGLPLGFAGTRAWVRRLRPGRTLADEERRAKERVLPLLRALAERTVLFSGDPHLFEAFARFALELGMAPPAGVILGARRRVCIRVPPYQPSLPLLLFEPTQETLRSEVDKLLDGRGVDLVVANSFFPRGRRLLSVPGMEFGFPSYRTHQLTDAPFLGYEGAVWLANRMFNAIGTDNRPGA